MRPRRSRRTGQTRVSIVFGLLFAVVATLWVFSPSVSTSNPGHTLDAATPFTRRTGPDRISLQDHRAALLAAGQTPATTRLQIGEAEKAIGQAIPSSGAGIGGRIAPAPGGIASGSLSLAIMADLASSTAGGRPFRNPVDFWSITSQMCAGQPAHPHRGAVDPTAELLLHHPGR
ncbi:MAG: hypothetical protein EXR43_02055 [Dehalococcoidia bacterium]|nr:hypothetical protein [Dehalococcoidia bacterium]